MTRPQQDAFTKTPGEAERALEWFGQGRGPKVVFVGKLIEQKGVDLLLDAWPAVLGAHREAKLLIAGFGSARGELEQAAERFGDSVAFAGRLEHEEVAPVFAAADAAVVPSVHPEAFGMVAAEAAATGTPPIVANHSGLAEVAQALAEDVGPEIGRLLTFELGDGQVGELADRLLGVLALDSAARDELAGQLAAAVERRWSWERVAAAVIAASRGELDALDRVG